MNMTVVLNQGNISKMWWYVGSFLFGTFCFLGGYIVGTSFTNQRWERIIEDLGTNLEEDDL